MFRIRGREDFFTGTWVLEVLMLRPVRVLNALIVACGTDVVRAGVDRWMGSTSDVVGV